MTDKVVQTVQGSGHIFSGTGDVFITQTPPLPGTAEELRFLGFLIQRVRYYWITGVLDSSLNGMEPLALTTMVEQQMVEHPWGRLLFSANGDTRPLPDQEPIATTFQNAGGFLLILGDPGGGKTITLLQLARILLSVAETGLESGIAVPVIFNLSTFSRRTRTLHEWITQELSSKYRIPAKIGRRWIRANRVLPLLDGLDEVRPELQARCIEAINAFISEHGAPGLVVCCRHREYIQRKERLRLNAAVLLQPIDPQQVEAYLQARGSELSDLASCIRANGELADLARNPLMLSIMSKAFQGSDAQLTVGALSETGSGENKRGIIFDRYLAHVLAQRGEPSFSSETTLWYLGQLAIGMQEHSQSIFLLEELQPTWSHGKFPRAAYLILSRMMTGGLMLLAFSLLLISLMSSAGSSTTQSHDTGRTIDLLLLGFMCGVPAACCGFYGALHDKLSSPARWRGLAIWILCFGFIIIAETALQHQDIFDKRKSAAENLGILWLGSVLYWPTITSLAVRGQRPFDRDVQLVDTLKWSWSGAGAGLILGVTAGMVTIKLSWWAISGFAGSYFFDLDLGVVLGVILFFIAVICAGIISGTIFAVGALRVAVIITKPRPNIGIWWTTRCAALRGLLAAVFSCFLVTAYLVFDGLTEAPAPITLIYPLAGATILVALPFGWLDVLYHYILRALLDDERVLPFRAVRFLDYGVRLAILYPVGGGYIFLHRLLMDHLANRPATFQQHISTDRCQSC